MTVKLKIFFGGKEVPLAHVQEWERRRALKVLRKLGERPESDDLPSLRQQLLGLKLRLGSEEIRARLSFELGVSDRIASWVACMSRGGRRHSIAEIVSDQGTADGFVHWFTQAMAQNRESVMLAAAPDHYVISTAADGSQEVIETNGGSPLVARFNIDYEDLSSLRSQVDPSYALQMAGVARSRSGLALGGVRHQFRDEGSGFRAKLLVEYPFLIMPGVISGHRWHLASEWANWIQAALEESLADAWHSSPE